MRHVNNHLFIIGTERSGTNLLRIILDSHSNISIPHPPHILKNFFRLEPLYSDLGKDSHFKKLIHDVVRTVELHPYPWDVMIDRAIVFKNTKERNLINIFFTIYDLYLNHTGKKRWGCKSTFMINHVALIRRYHPKAKFIYMVRDGRDVAVSAKKTIFNHYSVYYTAQLWKKEQGIGMHWVDKLPKENIFLLKYEDLLQNTTKMVKAICSFLCEPYEEDMLKFHRSPEARKSGRINRAWENTASPIMRNNFGKFKTELTKREIDVFEAIAAPELDYFSYKLTNPLSFTKQRSAKEVKCKLSYFFGEIFLGLAVQIKYFFSDKNKILRYKKFLFLIFIRMQRRLYEGRAKKLNSLSGESE